MEFGFSGVIDGSIVSSPDGNVTLTSSHVLAGLTSGCHRGWWG